MSEDLTDRQREWLDALPAETLREWGERMGSSKTGAESARERLEGNGVEIGKRDGQWRAVTDHDADGTGDPFEYATDPTDRSHLPDLSDVALGDDPDADDLSDRERLIVSELQQGVTPDELAEELDTRRAVVDTHLRELKRDGWRVYVDETAGFVGLEGDHALRSSEHIGTRTRKANRWWELRHNELVRQFRGLAWPDADHDADPDHEDWITHVTDLHAGDRVRDDAGNVLYSTDDIPAVVDYITERSIALADKHGSTYDTAHLLWGGDMVTNSGIYEGQFEDLDAWLDEQHEQLMTPLVRQLKAFADRFPHVNIVCQVGNHGEHRASGTSRQANADLILYKSIRNVVAHLQDHAGMLENVTFQIGQATPYKNFALRGGKLRGHLRHGQDRRPQAETSARKKEWLSTLQQHDFDIAFAGHYHVSGRVPWDGPPILFSSSPKPAGEFVERIGEGVPHREEGVATTCGVSDDGLTAVFPIDTRHFSERDA